MGKEDAGTIKPEQYGYHVAWSDEDGMFIGRVAEFPSLAAHGSFQGRSLREIRTVVAYVREDLTAEGEPLPVPVGIHH